MKRVKIIIAAALASAMLCSCGSNNNDQLPNIQSSDNTQTTSAASNEPTSSEETDVADTEIVGPFTFGEANEHANDGYSPETLRQMQYQEGKFNFTPIYFNERILYEETFDEFIGLAKASRDLYRIIEDTTTDGKAITTVQFESGNLFEFWDKRLVRAYITIKSDFNIKYNIVSIQFGDDVQTINARLGTKFVDYPELQALCIRDEDSLNTIIYYISEGTVWGASVNLYDNFE